MAARTSLDKLKQSLVKQAAGETQTLTNYQYASGFDVLARGSAAYEDFIKCQLVELVESVCSLRLSFSVLEIGPGPKSVLDNLPLPLKQKIKKYVAYEPNDLFASSLEQSIQSTICTNVVVVVVVGGGGGGGGGAGCKTLDIIRETKAAGLTISLGSRPSVGAGLWLQGGIGHLSRLHRLACDSIVGAVVASFASGQTYLVGEVPLQDECPLNAVRPKSEVNMLWTIKGAGTNFGIVVSVTFTAHPAQVYSIHSWVYPVANNADARSKLTSLGTSIILTLSRNCPLDIYLYSENDQLYLGVKIFESTSSSDQEPSTTTFDAVTYILGIRDNLKCVDSIELFKSELYMHSMHRGVGGGQTRMKTSSYKRCVFLKSIGSDVAHSLVRAAESRPSSQCYIHLLHAGGAVHDIAEDATAFGCRGWEYTCVITGVWPRGKDGHYDARSAVQWVYNVAMDLLLLSVGAYGADLGPDPTDRELAAKAFGPNLPRLARLKQTFDPRNVLACACPLPKAPPKQKVILLVTGMAGAGKDHCAGLWVPLLRKTGLTAESVSISDATKQEYAKATGADLDRLLHDREYKEQHR